MITMDLGYTAEQIAEYLTEWHTDGIDRQIYKVPAKFYEDHENRDCGLTDKVIKRNQLTVIVEMDYAGYQDLLTDADYYWSCRDSFDMVGRGLIQSARSTLSSLARQHAPKAHS